MQLQDLATPALVVDLDVLEKNIATMQERADGLSVSLRPHIKTHKCVEIGKMQLAAGATGITVSTLREAELFAKAGFTDMTWALPIPLDSIPRALELARSVRLRVLVDGPEAIEALSSGCKRADQVLPVWLKVDCGYHRAGVDPESDRAVDLVKKMTDSVHLSFDGILTHSGHAYDVLGLKQLQEAAELERNVMVRFAERLRVAGLAVPGISVGSTPAISVARDLQGVTEVRPGNYVFHDAMQAAIGSCGLEHCGVTVLGSVISHQPGASHFVTDAGALSLSKDRGATHAPETRGLGYVFKGLQTGGGLEKGLFLSSLSQEHGKVSADEMSLIEGRFKVGEKVRILEHHSCLTVALFDEMQVVRGDRVVDRWQVLRSH